MNVAAWMDVPGSICTRARKLIADGAYELAAEIVDEVAVAVSCNTVALAVLMASPIDLEDLAIGLLLTDGVARPSDIREIVVTPTGDGYHVDVRLAPAALEYVLRHRRNRVQRSFSSCGVCGVETIDDLPQVSSFTTPPVMVPIGAIRAAIADLPLRQALNRHTGAAHAAAWVTCDGSIQLLREDVGRHNALDKLIGARTRHPTGHGPGFCLITSRCSFEMVQKTIAAGIRTLVAISAPTALAVRTARAAGLTLVALARHDSQIVYAGAETLLDTAGADGF